MSEQNGPWLRLTTAIALRRDVRLRSSLRSTQVGGIYVIICVGGICVIICVSGGLRLRGPYPIISWTLSPSPTDPHKKPSPLLNTHLDYTFTTTNITLVTQFSYARIHGPFLVYHRLDLLLILELGRAEWAELVSRFFYSRSAALGRAEWAKLTSCSVHLLPQCWAW